MEWVSIINYQSSIINHLWIVYLSIFFQHHLSNIFQSIFQYLSTEFSNSFLFIFLKVFYQHFLFQEKFFVQKLILFIFFILFSLCQKNEGLTAWILLCLSSPLQKIQRTNRLRILLILPFPLSKRFQRTNRLRYLSLPLTKIQRTNRLRILCPNTLEGTSFVVQVEGASTWGLLYWEQERVHLLWISSSGGYIPCGSLACKGFYKVERNLKYHRLLGDWM